MQIVTGAGFKALASRFSPLDTPLYLVGGAVRNALLNLPETDSDVCAAAKVEDVETLSGGAFTVSEKAYGLGTLVIKSNASGECFEYTAFRKDSYGRGGTHRPESVTFTDDIKEDAKRRDFTINALYAQASGEITDPTGFGLTDIKGRLIRACSDTTLTEDALRILRMVRFSCELGFDIEPETWRAAKQNVCGLADISCERIYAEFEKILLSDAKYGNEKGPLKGLEMLFDLGALKFIMPELLEGDGFLQSPKYHKYDVLHHSFASCAVAPAELSLRLAALLHDVAKPASYNLYGNMYSHPEMGAKTALAMLGRLRAPKDLSAEVSALIGAHMFDLDNRAKRNTVRRMAAKLGRERFLKLIELRKADFAGSGLGATAESALKWEKILAEMERVNAPIDISQLNFTGKDVMDTLKIEQGPDVGYVLRALHAYALKKPSQNNYPKLAGYAKIVYADLLDKRKR